VAAILPREGPGLEEVAPGIARQKREAKRQLPVDTLLALVSGGIAPISRGAAMRAVAATPFKAARLGYQRGITRVPQRVLDWVEKIRIMPAHKTMRGQFRTGTKELELFPRRGELMRGAEKTLQEELAHAAQAEASRRGKKWAKQAWGQHKEFGQKLAYPYGYAASPIEYGAKSLAKEAMALDIPLSPKIYKGMLQRGMQKALRRGKTTGEILGRTRGIGEKGILTELIEGGVF